MEEEEAGVEVAVDTEAVAVADGRAVEAVEDGRVEAVGAMEAEDGAPVEEVANRRLSRSST